MKIEYIEVLLKMFPNIARGRKNFKYFEKRINTNIKLTKKYSNSRDKTPSK